MKTPFDGKLVCRPIFVERRNFLGSSGAALGLALLPSWAALATTGMPITNRPLQVRLAYLRDDGMFADASRAAFAASDKSVPVTMTAYGSSADIPFGIEAHCGADFYHRFWQARLQGRSMEISPPIRLRWTAPAGAAQHMVVTSRGARAQIEIPARLGIYALTLSNTSDMPPSLAGYGLADTSASGGNAVVKHRNTVPANFAYAVFDVRAA
jgi:hypothetical protein